MKYLGFVSNVAKVDKNAGGGGNDNGKIGKKSE